MKTRIVARQQQVVRIDREKRTALRPEHAAAAALAHIAALLPDIDAIIVEDYGKGLLDQAFATAIKPNRAEAFASAGLLPSEPVDPPTDDSELSAVGQILSRMRTATAATRCSNSRSAPIRA